jgi:hypothetical protein
MPTVVAIEICDVLPARLADPCVPRRTEPSMTALYESKPQVTMGVPSSHSSRIIFGTIVDDQVLKIGESLPQD